VNTVRSVFLALAVSLTWSCRHRTLEPAPIIPRPAPLSEISSPTQRTAGDTIEAASPAREKLITLNGEWDVRLALEEIARSAGYSLLIPASVPSKKVRLSLINVPASQALKAVLDAGQLRLEGATGMRAPWDPSLVFYQLPVNVDSLSAEAIAKRFGMSRELAEIIVRARRP
jgi:hypothetical protein